MLILALVLAPAYSQNPAGSKVMVTPSKVFTGPSKSGYAGGHFNHSPTPVRQQKAMNEAPRGQRSYYPYRYGYGYGYSAGYRRGYSNPGPDSNEDQRMRRAPLGQGQAQFKPRRFKPQFQPTKY